MDNEFYLAQKHVLKQKKNIKSIYFYRICGTGMGGAAALLKQAGYLIAGCDSTYYPPMSTYLESLDVPLENLDEVTDERLREFDLIVVGNVVDGKSKDARRIEGLGVKFCSFPAAIGALVLQEKHVIGIAGTHGKTTTTYLCKQLFNSLGHDVGYFIGGVIPDQPSAYLGDSDYFFIESDEYDSAYFEKFSKFHQYNLKSMILTSLEFDHADIFTDVEAIKDEFRKVIPTLSRNFIVNADYPEALELVREKLASNVQKLVPYGQASNNGPQIIDAGEERTKFFARFGEKETLFTSNLAGRHNLSNLTAAMIFASAEGASPEQVQDHIMKMKLPKRRQEVRGEYKGMKIIDDYAHHPTAIQLTLESLEQLYPEKKQVVIYEPHSATARSGIFTKDYIHAFRRVEKLFLTKIHRKTTAIGKKTLVLDSIIQGLDKRGVDSQIVTSLDEIIAGIEEKADEDSILIVMSNGTCLGLWESDFVKSLG